MSYYHDNKGAINFTNNELIKFEIAYHATVAPSLPDASSGLLLLSLFFAALSCDIHSRKYG